MEVDANPLIKESQTIACRYSLPVIARKLQSLPRLCKFCKNSLKLCLGFCGAVPRICLANIIVRCFYVHVLQLVDCIFICITIFDEIKYFKVYQTNEYSQFICSWSFAPYFSESLEIVFKSFNPMLPLLGSLRLSGSRLSRSSFII